MKTINFKEVTKDIAKRKLNFEKLRVNQKTAPLNDIIKNTKQNEFVNKDSILTVVTEEIVLAETKVLDFIKSDDFFLEDFNKLEKIDIKKEKKESKGFLKTISDFFTDETKQSDIIKELEKERKLNEAKQIEQAKKVQLALKQDQKRRNNENK